jgi:hypothetical protein
MSQLGGVFYGVQAWELAEDADDMTNLSIMAIPSANHGFPTTRVGLFLVYSCLLLSTSKLVFVYSTPLDIAQLNV